MGTVGVPWGLSVSVAAESQSRQSRWGKPTSGLCTSIPFPFLRMSCPGTGEARAAAEHPGNPPPRVLLPSGICSLVVGEELRAKRDQEKNFGQSWFSLRWQMSKPSLGWSLIIRHPCLTFQVLRTVYLSPWEIRTLFIYQP